MATSTTTTDLAGMVSSRTLVDLSLTLAEDLPCWWPAHMPFQQKTYSWFESRAEPSGRVIKRTGGSYQTRWLLMDEHTGTHCDAPSHFVPPAGSRIPNEGELGELSVERLDLRRLMGPAAVIDVTELSGRGGDGRSPLIEPSHVEHFEREHGRLEEGDVALLRSDWDRRYRPGDAGNAYSRDPLVTASGPGWPAPSAETVELLARRGVRCLGTDGVSVGGSDTGDAAHLAGLGRGMAYVEALSGLRRLPPRGAYFIFLPIKVADGTGGPGRAIALVP